MQIAVINKTKMQKAPTKQLFIRNSWYRINVTRNVNKLQMMIKTCTCTEFSIYFFNFSLSKRKSWHNVQSVNILKRLSLNEMIHFCTLTNIQAYFHQRDIRTKKVYVMIYFRYSFGLYYGPPKYIFKFFTIARRKATIFEKLVF
jgi:hypothetical protein